MKSSNGSTFKGFFNLLTLYLNVLIKDTKICKKVLSKCKKVCGKNMKEFHQNNNWMQNETSGYFVAVDGPNGSGKSFIAKELCRTFSDTGKGATLTREPTDAGIGKFLREGEEKTRGLSLACLVAADRYQHIESEILPNLNAGSLVVSDRYILSSLILQRMDGVDPSFIFDINARILKPDLQVVVHSSPEVIKRRLKARPNLTRLEREHRPEEEIEYAKEGIAFLGECGVRVFDLSNDDESNTESCISSLLQTILKDWDAR